MKKSPIPDNEEQRLKALRDYNILDTANEEEFDRLAQLASLICGTPIAVVSLIDESRQWLKSKIGLEEATETTRDDSFCQFTIMGNEIFEVTDATKDERFAENPFVTGYPDIRFYAGYPLTDPQGMNLGSLCVIDNKPRKLNKTQTRALEFLSKEVVHQIIARKEYSERIKLEKLFNYSRDLICIVGTDGLFKKVNPSFEKDLGYSHTELLGTPFLDLVHQDDKENTKAEIEKLTEGEKTIYFQNQSVRKDGSFVNLNWLANPDSETGEIYAIARDVTEKVRVLKELEEAKIIAERAVKVKDEFLSNMSHEIRTPLNAIIGFNDLLKQSPLNDEQKSYVEIVNIASQNLMVIINDILDISKLESGKLELEQQPVNIKEIAENVVNLQSQKAKVKGLKLLLSVDQDIPIAVIGDATRISQVLLNLVGNSIKFTERGYVELKIMELIRDEDKSTIRFTVKDTGIGIDKHKQHLIFERFTQAENSTTRVFGGTGLGLNISKMILDLYDSPINVQSEVGKGTEFTFELSLPIANPDEVKPTLGTINITNLSEKTLSGRAILVVEDNEHNQLLTSSYLKKNGAIVELAENGAVALEKLKKNTYDLVLMDLQMPVMDGFMATKAIRKELKLDLPIIACSAHSLIGERENCLEKGMNDYISKPYSEKTLINVLNTYLPDTPIIDDEAIKNIVANNLDIDDFKLILANTEKEHGKEFVDMMLEVFRRRIPSDIAELEEVLKNKDFEGIKSRAHLLAGSLSSLNFEIGWDLTKSIENAVINNDIEAVNIKTIYLIEYLKKSLETIG